jgi:hypothetical protein
MENEFRFRTQAGDPERQKRVEGMTRWDPQGKTQAMSQPTDVLESVGPFVRDLGRTFLLVVVEQGR